MSDDLVQFLRTRLDEDAAAAKRVESRWRQIGETGVIVASDGDRAEECANGNWTGVAEHIVRHDPARVLAEVEAKRRRLDTYEAACRRRDAEQQDFVDWAGGDARADRPSFAGPDPALIPGLEYAIRQDARVYRDHPDFDPSWLEN